MSEHSATRRRHPKRRLFLKIVAPIAVFLVGVATIVTLVRTRPPAETRSRDIPPPLVRVHRVQLEDLQLVVRSQGTVEPRTRTDLIPQVSGRVVEIAASFESGGFFEANEVLVRIDPTDFELAVVRARAAVAQAEVRVVTERAEAEVARREWKELGSGDANPLVTREPQMLEAEASLAAAQASLRQAEVELDRTKIRVPFPGRVRTKNSDVGEYVSRGMPVGEVYAIDYAEVRLPVPDEELAFLSRTWSEPDGEFSDATPTDPISMMHAPNGGALRVTLRARFGGAMRHWEGQIVRTEGEIDPRTRMLHVVARVADPYGKRGRREAPLAAGLFVHAEIAGNRVQAVALLPRAAIRGRDQVLVVDAESRLRFRTVEVLRAQGDQVVVGSGVSDGDRVLLSPLEAVTDGMRVRTAPSTQSRRDTPADGISPADTAAHGAASTGATP